MKKVALITLALLVVALSGLGWLYMSAQVKLVDVRTTIREASTDPAAFAELKAQAAADAMVGTVFRRGELHESEDYVLITFEVTVNNATLLDLELAEAQIAPMEGDILQLAATPKRIGAGSVETLSVTVLADVGSHAVREMTVTGYLWGIRQSLKAYTR